MKLNKGVLTIIIVIFTVLLSSCAGKEPNDIAYVVALGIDSGENNNYKITIQYANTTQISGGSSEQGGKAGTEIVDNIAVEAPNIYAAMEIANDIVSKTFSLSHANLIVFSKEVAQNGIKDIIESIARSEEIRPDVYLAVAREEANQYLTSVTPEMEVNPAQYYQLIYQKINGNKIPAGQKKNFFLALETGDFDNVLPIAGVIKASDKQEGTSSGSSSSEDGSDENSEDKSSSGEKKQEENSEQKKAPLNEGPYEYKIRDYIGGQAAIQKKNKSEVIGSAIFSRDKLVCMMGSVEDGLFKILEGDYDYNYITFFSKATPDVPITVKAAQAKKPKYNIDLKNKKIDIELFIEGDLFSLPADYDVEKDIENFEKSVEEDLSNSCKEFITDFISKYDSDIFRLKEKSKKHFLTNKEYENFKNTVDFKEYHINVKTNFNIRRTGLIIKEENR